MEIRTHTCGELNREHIGKSVILNGWINTVRLHGQVVFIDLRERYGKTQILYNSEKYFTGRSPIEAESIGINLEPNDVCYRCNLVTIKNKNGKEVMEIIRQIDFLIYQKSIYLM